MRANPERASFATALPEIITITQKLGIEKIQKFTEFIGAVTGGSSAETGKLIGYLGQSNEGMATLRSLTTSYNEAAKGDYRASTASLAEAVGSGWNTLPEATRNRMATKVASSVAGSKIGPFVGVLAEAGAGDGMKAVAGLMRGDGKDFFDGLKGVTKSLSENPTLSKKFAPRLVKSMLDAIPEKSRNGMLAKMVGRKIPAIGTVLVGLTDLGAIASKPNDPKTWMGLGSTVAGALPGAGTAASVVIDIGILGVEVYDAVRSLGGDLKVTNPAAS
ncbi:hypothetical protein D7X30_27330 [Corallococcus sp. AB011P]|nr:hypothetical protein D7X30_27330 [Corallococcus sp. AB011P]